MNLEVKDELIKFADERIKKYLKVLNIPYHLEGKITKINADGTYSVRIQGEEETSINKSREKKSLYIQCINKINSKSCFVDKEDYDEANKLYLIIKRKYKNEIKLNKMNIKVEKIRIQREIGKYQNESMKYSLSMMVGIIASSIVIIIQGTVSTIKVHPMYIMTPLTVLILLFFLMRQADKSLRGR